MADPQQIFEEYKEAVAAGRSADPRPYLEGVSGRDRALLAALIDAYLQRAPRERFDAPAFRASGAAPVAEAVHRSLTGVSGLWPALLPRLRNQAQVRRDEPVDELAARLGAEAQRDKVGDYYHRMEQGRLPAAGVSDTVLEALGAIIGYTREALKRAGEMPARGGGAAAPGAVFARTAPSAAGADEGPSAAPARAEEWDEVDRLFCGG
jgi:hypothetical protein